MKKDYFKPAMRVVEMKQRQILCGSGGAKVNSVSTNMVDDDDFGYVGGGNGQGR